MDLFDSFLWLHIGSFLTKYNDLAALSSTCRELRALFEPQKTLFTEWHLRQIQWKLMDLETHISTVSFLSKTEKHQLLDDFSHLGEL